MPGGETVQKIFGERERKARMLQKERRLTGEICVMKDGP